MKNRLIAALVVNTLFIGHAWALDGRCGSKPSDLAAVMIGLMFGIIGGLMGFVIGAMLAWGVTALSDFASGKKSSARKAIFWTGGIFSVVFAVVIGLAAGALSQFCF